MSGCAVCGNAGSKTNPVLSLHELGGPTGFQEAIDLCQSCLRAREVASWTWRGKQALKIHDALQNHGAAARARYAYLEERRGIHLVRIRHDWIMSHAMAPPA